MHTDSLMKAIDDRCSRRKYLGTPIDHDAVLKINEYIAKYNKETGIRFELVINDGNAFKGFTKSYGMFSGVNDYVCLIADRNDSTAVERLGYYGELLVLHITAIGLSSCWVGNASGRSDMPIVMTDNETLACVILLGNTEEKRSIKERLIHNLTHRKTKSAEEMFVSDVSVPDWFMQGMKAVQKAPSAINRQPVMFMYEGGKVIASVKSISDTMFALDFGIAKLHFELGAGGGEWEWGNGGKFSHKANTIGNR